MSQWSLPPSRRVAMLLVCAAAAYLVPACGPGRKGKGPLELPPRVAITAGQAGEPVVVGSYIVAFHTASEPFPEAASPSRSAAFWQSYLSEQHFSDPRLSRIRSLGPLQAPGKFTPAFGRDSVHAAYYSPLQALPTRAPTGQAAYGLAEVEFVSAAAAAEVLGEWQSANQLWFAEPNRVSQLYGASEVSAKSSPFQLVSRHLALEGVPWWLQLIKIAPVFNALAESDLGSPPGLATHFAPVIAVLDSGVDFQHRALQGQIWRNPHPGTAGCLNDEYGCDTTHELADDMALGWGNAFPYGTSGPGESCPNSVLYQCMHGTHVAGILAAQPFPGGAGVCPVCKILPIKAVEEIDGEGKVTDSAILRALRYIAQLNLHEKGLVRIVNSSFGKFQWSRAVALLVAELQEADVLFVAAAGNENSQERVFPAALPGTLAVTAVDAAGQKSGYANFGSWVDIAAPGGGLQGPGQGAIVSTVPGQGFFYSQGTSVATPVVAGVAGLLLATRPELTGRQLFERIRQTADSQLYRPQGNGGYNRHYAYELGSGEQMLLLGTGLLDAERALSLTPLRTTRGKGERRVEPACAVLAVGRPGDDGQGPQNLRFSHLILGIFLAAVAAFGTLFGRREHEA